MKELNMEELNEVSGGILPLIIIGGAAIALSGCTDPKGKPKKSSWCTPGSIAAGTCYP